mgnify:CR=1 FL=1
MPRGFPVGVRVLSFSLGKLFLVMILQTYVISEKNVSKNLIQCTSVGFLGNGYSFKLKKPLLSSAGGTIFFSSFEVSAGWTTAASLTEVSYSGPL